MPIPLAKSAAHVAMDQGPPQLTLSHLAQDMHPRCGVPAKVVINGSRPGKHTKNHGKSPCFSMFNDFNG